MSEDYKNLKGEPFQPENLAANGIGETLPPLPYPEGECVDRMEECIKFQGKSPWKEDERKALMLLLNRRGMQNLLEALCRVSTETILLLASQCAKEWGAVDNTHKFAEQTQVTGVAVNWNIVRKALYAASTKLQGAYSIISPEGVESAVGDGNGSGEGPSIWKACTANYAMQTALVRAGTRMLEAVKSPEEYLTVLPLVAQSMTINGSHKIDWEVPQSEACVAAIRAGIASRDSVSEEVRLFIESHDLCDAETDKVGNALQEHKAKLTDAEN